MNQQPSSTCEVVVMLENGLHLSPAAQIVKTAQAFRSTLVIQKGDRRIDGKSMLDLMTLAAEYGAKLRLETSGDDAEAALRAVVALFERNFDHDAVAGRQPAG